MANPTTQTTQTGSNGPPTKGKETLIPPEPKFWQRYSPHHEAPLSSVSSFFLHVSVLALFALIFWLGSRLSDSNKSIPVDAVAVTGLEGGGGNPSGQADRRPSDSEGKCGRDAARPKGNATGRCSEGNPSRPEG